MKCMILWWLAKEWTGMNLCEILSWILSTLNWSWPLKTKSTSVYWSSFLVVDYNHIHHRYCAPLSTQNFRFMFYLIQIRIKNSLLRGVFKFFNNSFSSIPLMSPVNWRCCTDFQADLCPRIIRLRRNIGPKRLLSKVQVWIINSCWYHFLPSSGPAPGQLAWLGLYLD